MFLGVDVFGFCLLKFSGVSRPRSFIWNIILSFCLMLCVYFCELRKSAISPSLEGVAWCKSYPIELRSALPLAICTRPSRDDPCVNTALLPAFVGPQLWHGDGWGPQWGILSSTHRLEEEFQIVTANTSVSKLGWVIKKWHLPVSPSPRRISTSLWLSGGHFKLVFLHQVWWWLNLCMSLLRGYSLFPIFLELILVSFQSQAFWGHLTYARCRGWGA